MPLYCRGDLDVWIRGDYYDAFGTFHGGVCLCLGWEYVGQ